MMKPISNFWSDESPGRTRSAHVACAQLLGMPKGQEWKVDQSKLQIVQNLWAKKTEIELYFQHLGKSDSSVSLNKRHLSSFGNSEFY